MLLFIFTQACSHEDETKQTIKNNAQTSEDADARVDGLGEDFDENFDENSDKTVDEIIEPEVETKESLTIFDGDYTQYCFTSSTDPDDPKSALFSTKFIKNRYLETVTSYESLRCTGMAIGNLTTEYEIFVAESKIVVPYIAAGNVWNIDMKRVEVSKTAFTEEELHSLKWKDINAQIGVPVVLDILGPPTSPANQTVYNIAVIHEGELCLGRRSGKTPDTRPNTIDGNSCMEKN